MGRLAAYIELAYSIFDGGDLRRVAVIAERPALFGAAKKRCAGALEVKLDCARLSNKEVADLYD